MTIKHFKLKDNVQTTEPFIMYGFTEGGTWITKDAALCYTQIYRYKKNNFSFSINVSVNKDVRNWNDYDNVLILDEAFLQPYTPFYDALYEKEVPNLPALEFVVKQYNKLLSKMPFLEMVEEK